MIADTNGIPIMIVHEGQLNIYDTTYETATFTVRNVDGTYWIKPRGKRGYTTLPSTTIIEGVDSCEKK